MDAPKERSSECNHSTVVKEENDHIHDALFEILMRVDPRDIFKCILVSKDWLSVITTPIFRTNYLNKWKDSSTIVVGLLLDRSWQRRMTPGCPGVQLLATSHVGTRMIARNSVMENAFFLSKSPRGGLLLFCDVDRDSKFYVCKPISGGPPDELPPPPVGHGECYKANILCDDDDGEDYRVILANTGYQSDGEDDYVCTVIRIQTYCSWTGNWEQSTLTTKQEFLHLSTDVEYGIVTKRGNAIYWELNEYKHPHYGLAGWDMNGDYVGMIPKPPVTEVFELFRWNTTYGVSPQPQGSLLAATSSYRADYYRFNDAWEVFNINILALDDDKKVWDLLYSVRHASIWNNNLQLLATLFGVTLPNCEFVFVSFIPGKTDSVFLSLYQLYFVYHFPTGKLEHLDILDKSDLPCFFGRKNFVYPLTLLDLGSWPSPPPSLQLSHCS